jgi:hypothetical protein
VGGVVVKADAMVVKADAMVVKADAMVVKADAMVDVDVLTYILLLFAAFIL